MKQIEVTDEWLCKYMPIVGEAIIRELEEGTDYGYRFSAKFERRMKLMLWKEEHPWIRVAYRQLKRTAVLSICVAAGLLILTMSVEGNRMKLFDTIRTLREDSAEYTYFTDEEEGEFRKREPAYLPEGYEEVKRSSNGIHFRMVFENSMCERITWDQWLALDKESIVLDIEYDSQMTYEVEGKFVTVCLYSDGFKYAYCENERYVYLLTADDITIDEICKMFQLAEE